MQLKEGVARACYWAGLYLEWRRDWNGAARVYGHASRLAPKFAKVSYRLGRIYERQRKWKQASSAYHRAVELKPLSARWWMRLGQISGKQEDWRLASKYFSQATQLNPREKVWQIRLARALERCESWEAATEAYGRALKLMTGEATPHVKGEALTDMDVKLYVRLGAIAMKVGKWAVADKALSVAVEARPNDLDLCYQLALTRKETAGNKAALKILEQAIKYSPSYDWEYRLAEAIERCGDVRRAAVIYKKLLSPDHGAADLKYSTSVAISRHAAKRRKVTIGHEVKIHLCSSFEPLDLKNPISLARSLSVSLQPFNAKHALPSSDTEDGQWQKCFVEELKRRFTHCEKWLERNGYILKKAHTEGAECEAPVIKSVGVWNIANDRLSRGNEGRLLFEGTVNSQTKTVFLFFNDQIVKAINVRDRNESNKSLPRAFAFTLKEQAVRALPRVCRVSIGCADGILTTPSGDLEMILIREHGEGSMLTKLVSPRYHINKKGRLRKRFCLSKKWQKAVLDAYEKLAVYFQQRLNREIFIFHGTLLGAVRDKGFIPNDDDFDIAFFSQATSAVDVKEDLKSVMTIMAGDGWEVRTNSHRRMFKVRVNNLWIDCFAVWCEDGRIWSHNNVCYKGARSEFLPLKYVALNNVTVAIPKEPEACLLGLYGEGWRYPDPGYQAERLSSDLRKNLARALLSPKEMKSLRQQGVIR